MGWDAGGDSSHVKFINGHSITGPVKISGNVALGVFGGPFGNGLTWKFSPVKGSITIAFEYHSLKLSDLVDDCQLVAELLPRDINAPQRRVDPAYAAKAAAIRVVSELLQTALGVDQVKPLVEKECVPFICSPFVDGQLDRWDQGTLASVIGAVHRLCVIGKDTKACKKTGVNPYSMMIQNMLGPSGWQRFQHLDLEALGNDGFVKLQRVLLEMKQTEGPTRKQAKSNPGNPKIHETTTLHDPIGDGDARAVRPEQDDTEIGPAKLALLMSMRQEKVPVESAILEESVDEQIRKMRADVASGKPSIGVFALVDITLVVCPSCRGSGVMASKDIAKCNGKCAGKGIMSKAPAKLEDLRKIKEEIEVLNKAIAEAAQQPKKDDQERDSIPSSVSKLVVDMEKLNPFLLQGLYGIPKQIESPMTFVDAESRLHRLKTSALKKLPSQDLPLYALLPKPQNQKQTTGEDRIGTYNAQESTMDTKLPDSKTWVDLTPRRESATPEAIVTGTWVPSAIRMVVGELPEFAFRVSGVKLEAANGGYVLDGESECGAIRYRRGKNTIHRQNKTWYFSVSLNLRRHRCHCHTSGLTTISIIAVD